MKKSILNPIRKLLRFPFFETILYFLASKLGLSNLVAKVAPGNNLYKTNSIRKTNRNGINYILDLSDYQHWIIYFGITKDDPIGLFELVKSGDTIIDIGTNIGQTAMMFAKLGGKETRVYGFEPDPINYALATENLKLNSFKNIQLFNFGLGSKIEELRLKVNSSQNRGGNRIDRFQTKDSFTIKIDTLDHVLEKDRVTKVNLIKIDVEGFELEVLKGAKNTITNFKPTLFIEVDDTNLREQGGSAEELLRYVMELGYVAIESINKQVIKKDQDFKNTHFDIICNYSK